MKERRQEKFLVIGMDSAGEVKDLQAVIKRVSLGVIPKVLLDIFQR